MKLSCTQENLKKAIFCTERVIGKQSTLPILENILLETENGRLKVSATNLELGVYIRVGAKIINEGRITVPSKIISNFIHNLPSGETVDLDINDQILNIHSGKHKAKIKCLPADDFPIIPETKQKRLISLSAQDFKNNLPRLLMSVSLDNARPELAGVNMILEQKSICLAATDSFRLSEIIMPIKESDLESYDHFREKNPSLIIPANALAEMLRSIDPMDEKIDIIIEENQIFFQIGEIKIISRLVNGKYPEYRQIMPKEFVTHVFFQKDESLRAVRMASLFTLSKGGEIILKVQPEAKIATISTHSEERGENTSDIGIEGSGRDQEIVLNPRYIMDGINSVNGERLAFLANTESSPVVIKIYDEEKHQPAEGFTYVIMPIKK